MIKRFHVPPGVRPAIVLFGLIAGLYVDGWYAWASFVAAWFINAQAWDPYANERKPDDARS